MINRRAVAVAAMVSACAFLLYHATLLPGLGFGDTASFQAGVGAPLITPRDGYPLYFAIGRLFLHFVPDNPAYAVNLASSVEAAVACGLFVLVATELRGSLFAGVAAAALFAGSYTFWSQAVIAEVYSLHAVCVTLSLFCLFRWARQPTLARLGIFFAVYAFGFGNHLSMVLLMPGFTLFLLLAEPKGWRAMVAPRVVALAAACAFAGALQYAWNLRALWILPHPPHALTEAAERFWFDVTKVDWRETLVLRVPQSMLANRVASYGFDLHQQFGWLGPAVAVAGLIFLVKTSWRVAMLMAALYAVNVAFAFGYNVGDTHVFYLPSHLIVALLVAPGLVLLGRAIEAPAVVAGLMLAYAGVRTYHDYPALDRSRDTRPTATLSQLTAGLDDRHAVLLTAIDWQSQNGLNYFGQYTRPEVAYTRAADVLLYLPGLVADNNAASREIATTERAYRMVADAYGPLFAATPDPRVAAPSLVPAVERVLTGARYVFCVLKPGREFALDWTDLGRALAEAGDGAPIRVPDGDYIMIAGVRGRPPSLMAGSNSPFDRTFDLDGVPVEVRMDAWLASDTIRRMGFGHVIANRVHSLIVERGVSFVAIDDRGEPLVTAYAANLFAPEPRYLIRLSGLARPSS